MHQFKDACHFPDQLKLIEESVTNESLAKDIAGRLGLGQESYTEVCEAALEHQANLKTHQAQRYQFSEIASSASGAMKRADASAPSRSKQTKIKAVLQNAPTREGVLEEVV